MKRERADGVSADRRVAVAANEEFTGIVSRPESDSLRHAGWDPYEVWRTRVKTPPTKPRQRDPLR